MYCTHCGVAVSPDARFCAQCGTKVTEGGETGEPQPQSFGTSCGTDAMTTRSAHAASKEAPAGVAATVPAKAPAGKQAEPEIESGDLKAARAATSAAAVLICVTALVFLLVPPFPLGARVIVFVLYAVIALGTWKLFRIATVAGLILASSNIVSLVGAILYAAGHKHFNLDTGLIAPALILNGFWIRWAYRSMTTTFAYHRSRAISRMVS